jgi:glycerol-3-phosphate dehydrogenase
VRPLWDDASASVSRVTRDYRIELSHSHDQPPLLSIFGGKLTTYRKLAEHALAELASYFPSAGPAWTERAPLPGGDLPAGDLAAFIAELTHRYPALPARLLRDLAHRHGSLALRVLRDAKVPADLGEDFGNGLTAAEIDYFVREEWARTAADVLWRRTKCGLAMRDADRARVDACVAAAQQALGLAAAE